MSARLFHFLSILVVTGLLFGGACTVRVNGEIVRGCLMLAVQANGCRVDTIEGLSDSGELASLQKSFHERNALQCGFCTPWNADGGAGLAQARRKTDPGRDSGTHLGQLLPLHRLPGHRRRHRGSGEWARLNCRSTRPARRSTGATSARACRGRTRRGCCRGAARSSTTCAFRGWRTSRFSEVLTLMPG